MLSLRFGVPRSGLRQRGRGVGVVGDPGRCPRLVYFGQLAPGAVRGGISWLSAGLGWGVAFVAISRKTILPVRLRSGLRCAALRRAVGWKRA